MASVRGADGGHKLARPPAEITVAVHDNFWTSLIPVEPGAGDRHGDASDATTIALLDAQGHEVGTMHG